MNHLTPIIGADPNPTIKVGSQGESVKQWQKIVGVLVDGNFGSATEAATKKWQKDRELVDDGVVGPRTWEASGSKVKLASMFSWIPSLPLWIKVGVGTFLAGVFVISRRK